MAAKHRAHGDILVRDCIVPERSRKVIAPPIKFVVEFLYGTLNFCPLLGLEMILAVIDGIDLPQDTSRDLIQSYQSESASHE
jgi:hypothetical protein